MKKFLILASIAALIALGIYLSQSIQNGAIVREEQVNAAQSDMTTQYRRRADLLGNLADAVKSYSQHEAEIFRDMAKGRTPEGKNGEVNAATYINAVAEHYPELKSSQNYENYMNELSLTEDKIAKVREHYNAQVEEYRRFTRKFPNILFLNIVNYKLIDYKHLDYQSVINDSQKNLLR